MRAMKSVLIVTRMGYIEGVFTSFRALANSRGDVLEWQERTRVYRAIKELERKRPQARESH